MKRDKLPILAVNLGKRAKGILEGKGKDIKYPGRSTGHIRRASDILGNDFVRAEGNIQILWNKEIALL